MVAHTCNPKTLEAKARRLTTKSFWANRKPAWATLEIKTNKALDPAI